MEGEGVVLASLGRVPAGLELDVQQAGGGSYRKASAAAPFEAHKRWRKLDMVVPLGLCLFFLGFLGWTHGLEPSGAVATLLAIMTALTAALTLLATWYLVAYALNRSTLVVSADALRVRTGPVPWPWRRGVTLAASPELRIQAVAVRREAKDLSPQMRREMKKTGKPVMLTRWWNLVALTPNGEVPLLRQLTFEQAHHLAERAHRAF